MKMLSISTIIRLILLAVILSIFFACSSSSDKKEKITTGNPAYWAIPAQYQNVPIEQIKSQVEITEYKTIKGAATTAGTESMSGWVGDQSLVRQGGGAIPEESNKSIADRAALASYANKTISLEGVVDVKGTNPTSPLMITEPELGKYQIWFCDKTRKPCRYQAFLLYIGPEGKGDNLFTKDNRIRFVGIILEEELRNVWGNWKRFPKIRVLELEVIK